MSSVIRAKGAIEAKGKQAKETLERVQRTETARQNRDAGANGEKPSFSPSLCPLSPLYVSRKSCAGPTVWNTAKPPLGPGRIESYLDANNESISISANAFPLGHIQRFVGLTSTKICENLLTYELNERQREDSGMGAGYQLV